MTKNYSSSTLSVWRKPLNIVHSIVAPILFIWKQQYFKVIAVVNAACEKINVSFVSLRKGYLKRKKSIQDALDRWSAHSSVGYALVIGFNAPMMLLMTTFAIEFAYHFRPYYWRITLRIVMMIYSLTRLGLWLVFRQGMILMHNLIFLCFWLMSGFFAGVRSTCLFLVLVASKASSAVTFVSWLFVRNASSVLNGFTRVATSDSLPASALIRSNSQSPVCGAIALIVGAASFFLVILAWRRRKQAKLGFNSKNLTAGLYPMQLSMLCPSKGAGGLRDRVGTLISQKQIFGVRLPNPWDKISIQSSPSQDKILSSKLPTRAGISMRMS